MSVAVLAPAISDAMLAGDNPTVLRRIREPAVHLTLWRRQRLARLDWIDALAWDDIDDIAALLAEPDYAADIARLLADAGYPRDGRNAALAGELAMLARIFADIVGTRSLRLRLEVIETDACRKFHTDYVPARLLMTLAGPGTQWVASEGGAADGAVDPPIHQLASGEVAIFKGRSWTDTPAILHRSPPIAGTGETRLLLVIDPAGGQK